MNRTFIAATGIDRYPTTDFNPFNTAIYIYNPEPESARRARSTPNPQEQPSRSPL